MDPSEFTPSQVYEGDPINSRLVLIIVFCVGIPITWVISYFGLYMYFKEWTSKVQYTLISQVLYSKELMTTFLANIFCCTIILKIEFH